MATEALGDAEQGSVLASIRRALGRSGDAARPTPLEPFVEETLAGEGGELVFRFIGEAEAAGARVYRVRSPEEACARVADIAAGAREVAVSGATVLTEMGLRETLSARGLSTFGVADSGAGGREELLARLAGCGVGVTAVDYAIAETGTIVLTSDEEGGLLASLLPAAHVAVLDTRQIFSSLASVIEKLGIERMGRSGRPCRSATFITGPSRTSDVELVLSIGVHGPKELHLVILGQVVM